MAMKYNIDNLRTAPKSLETESDVEKKAENTLDTMFRINPRIDEIVEVKLDDIRDFGGDYGRNRFKFNPFKAEEVSESIRECGILTPILIRNDKAGKAKYECIAGKHRREAARIAGKETIPSIIKECSDEEAVLIMAITNCQREALLPSERAWLYRIQYDSLTRKT